MAKRYIGVDIDANQLRVALAEDQQGQPVLLSTAARSFAELGELPAALREILGEPRRLSDRAAAALPAREAYVRWLQLPFAEPGKVEAALPFELSAQLPVAVEECATAFRKPLPLEAGGFRLTAAAARTTTLAPLLESLDDGAEPLHIVDLAPFAYAAGLRRHITDALLLSATGTELTLCLVRQGQVEDFRLLPLSETVTEEETARFVLREALSLQRDGGRELPCYGLGSGITASLEERLAAAGLPLQPLPLKVAGRALAPEFAPAAALALRAAVPEKEREFNFRCGPFALKSEWAALKKKLTGGAALLGLILAVLAGSAWLNHSRLADRAGALEQEMRAIYRTTFPASKVIIDVPLQMKSALAELRKQGQPGGAGATVPPLEVLGEISRALPEGLSLEVRELTYGGESVRLEGHTVSFEAINRFAKALESSPRFAKAQISDAKMSLDGSRVDFRVLLSYANNKEGA